MLDGSIISAPVNESAINGQTTQITGKFTQKSARTQLANQLKYGALPLSFTTQDALQVSATLGTSQLKAGLLAGGIGLILVVLYSLIYYRGARTGHHRLAARLRRADLRLMLVMLGTQIGFTLSLAGIAGFIVAVGITADSFVVFFERIKDEVHEGRSARVAIPRAWIRARRTILSADTVSFLAAAILYYFAAGDVKGFAFTLGLSTILDLVVVFLFTHPLVSLLSRLRSFGSRRFTGLDAIRGGPALPDEPLVRSSTAARRAAGAKPQRSRGRAARAASRPGVDGKDGPPGRDAAGHAATGDSTSDAATERRSRQPRSRPRPEVSSSSRRSLASRPSRRLSPSPGPRPSEQPPGEPGCASRRATSDVGHPQALPRRDPDQFHRQPRAVVFRLAGADPRSASAASVCAASTTGSSSRAAPSSRSR